MNLTVLISCMHEKDHSIIERSNVQSDVVVINQCDMDYVQEFDFINKGGQMCHAKFINTSQRGLSNSRNMAIDNAWGDIGYVCDDDEYLADDYVDTITSAYKAHPNSSVIIFSINRKGHTYPSKEQKVGIKQILKTSSVQTTFRIKDILDKKIKFDTLMGSGTGNGGGEENKFLMDCKRKSLSLLYIPQTIATVKSEDSQWFHGFTKKYYIDTTWANRRILGSFLGALYMAYWVVFRRNNYKQELSFFEIIKACYEGYFEKRG